MSPALGSGAQILLDQYANLDFKGVIGTAERPGDDWLAPTWVGVHRRRLQAYALLQGYRDNVAHAFLQALYGESASELIAAKALRREYGDAKVIIEQTRASVLGDSQTVVVTDAENDETAAQRQEELQQWAEDDRLITKVVETERNATTFGDGVYSVHWDPDKGRVVVLPWDPGSYFPVLDGIVQGDYPTRVHLAWQLPDDEVEERFGERFDVVHRLTYEIVQGEVWTPPWADKPTRDVCLVTEADYILDRDARDVDDLTAKKVIYSADAGGQEINRLDLGIDFIPVVHIPNTIAENEHYGQSVIASIAQIIDDLQQTDTDLQAAANLTGFPVPAISGEGIPPGEIRMRPGVAIKLGKNGKIEMLSGSEGMLALANHRNDLLDRASVNSRLPKAQLGRVDATDVPSGVALSLSFSPLQTLIEEMRLARKDKYRLLLKFVQRYMLANHQIDGEILDADLEFGSYMPNDVATTVSNVTQLYAAKLISRATAMKMLQEVGIPILDTAEEEKEINKTDLDGAIKLLEASGNDEEVGKFLGVEVKEPPEPVITPGMVGSPQPASPTDQQNEQ